MPTLFTRAEGFRFPYLTWAETSTPQNLQFLEALLTLRLHKHEDDGSTLWVTPSGFRLPHLKGHENFEANMAYVEGQLNEYLHVHEIDDGVNDNIDLMPIGGNTGGEGGDECEPYVYGANILRDPGFELQALFVDYGPDGEDITEGGGIAANLSGLYWPTPGQPGVEFLESQDPYYVVGGWSVFEIGYTTTHTGVAADSPFVSTANPRSGTYHLRASLSAEDSTGFDMELFPLGGETCTDIKSYSAVVFEGDSWTFSGYVNVDHQTANVDWFAYIEAAYFDLDHNIVGTQPFVEDQIGEGAYQLVTLSDTVPANAFYLAVVFGTYWDSAGFDFHAATNVDWDDFTLELVDGGLGPGGSRGFFGTESPGDPPVIAQPFTEATLVTTVTGFRFPYAWHEENAKRDNTRFMQDQITKYMHTHEVSE